MTYHRNQQNVAIANVSRRRLLKKASPAPACSFSPGNSPAVRSAMAYPTGAEKMPHGLRPIRTSLSLIDKDGTVTIVAHRAEMGNGAARTSSSRRVVADELEADWALRSRRPVAWRRGDLRQSAHRVRLAQRASTSSSPCARLAPAHARCSRPRPPCAGASTSTRSRRGCMKSCMSRSGSKFPLRRACRRCGGLAGAGARYLAAQEAERVPLYRQRQCHHRRSAWTSRPAKRLMARTSDPRACCSPSSPARRWFKARSPLYDASGAMKVPGVLKVVTIDGNTAAGRGFCCSAVSR